MIHLDTNFLIGALQAGSPESEKLERWARANETITMSAVAWTEFLCGPLDAGAASVAATLVDRRLDFTVEMAEVAARLFNRTGRRRNSITDCMIAAAAIAEDTGIATSDLQDFSRFEQYGLMLL